MLLLCRLRLNVQGAADSLSSSFQFVQGPSSSLPVPSRAEMKKKEEGKRKKGKRTRFEKTSFPKQERYENPAEFCKMALWKRALLRKGSVENGAADYRIEKLTFSARRAKKKRIPKLKKSSERWSTMTKASTSFFLGRRRLWRCSNGRGMRLGAAGGCSDGCAQAAGRATMRARRPGMQTGEMAVEAE